MQDIITKCLNCGCELNGSNQVKFCSKSCAAKYNNSRRKHSEETKRKISESLINRAISAGCKKYRDVNFSRVCCICGNEFVPGKRNDGKVSEANTCSQECRHKLYVRNGKSVQQKLILEGRHIGWNSRNVTSYPELFWIDVLNNNGIAYTREYHFGKYFLDFYMNRNGKKIDLEIDGKQHNYPERKESDISRDKFLTENNFIVYRIEWNQINDELGKNEMKTKIDRFLNWYNSL